MGPTSPGLRSKKLGRLASQQPQGQSNPFSLLLVLGLSDPPPEGESSFIAPSFASPRPEPIQGESRLSAPSSDGKDSQSVAVPEKNLPEPKGNRGLRGRCESRHQPRHPLD